MKDFDPKILKLAGLGEIDNMNYNMTTFPVSFRVISQIYILLKIFKKNITIMLVQYLVNLMISTFLLYYYHHHHHYHFSFMLLIPKIISINSTARVLGI